MNYDDRVKHIQAIVLLKRRRIFPTPDPVEVQGDGSSLAVRKKVKDLLNAAKGTLSVNAGAEFAGSRR